MGGEAGGGVNALNRVGGAAGGQGVGRADIGRLGDNVARRGGDRDLVGAGGETGEGDVAVGVGGPALAGGSTGAGQQGDGHATEAGFAAALRTVAIGVGIDMGGEAGRGVDALNRVGGAAGGQGVGRADIGRLGDNVARRGGHGHFVGARDETREGHVAIGIGHGGLAGRGAGAGQEGDGHASEAALTRTLRTVAVGVGIDMGGEAGGDVNAFGRVGRRVGNQGHRGADIGLLGDAIAIRGDDLHFVITRDQAGELDIAVGVGDRGLAGRIAGPVQQIDGHAGQVSLPVILNAIGVGIGVDMDVEIGRGRVVAAAAAGRNQAGLDIMIGLTRGQDDRAGDPGGRVGAAVDRGIGAHALLAERVAVQRVELHLIGAGEQVAEIIPAIGIGHGGRDGRAGAVQQLNRYTRHARTGVKAALQAGLVRVEEDDIADGAKLGLVHRAKAHGQNADTHRACRPGRCIQANGRVQGHRDRYVRLGLGEIDRRGGNMHQVRGQCGEQVTRRIEGLFGKCQRVRRARELAGVPVDHHGGVDRVDQHTWGVGRGMVAHRHQLR